MPVHRFPDPIFLLKDAGRSEGDRGWTVAAADLRSQMLDLGDARQPVAEVRRYAFEPHNLTVSVARGGTLGHSDWPISALSLWPIRITSADLLQAVGHFQTSLPLSSRSAASVS